MAIAGDKPPLFASGQADTLRLIVYLIAAVALMITDHHGRYLDQVRAALSTLVVPLYRIAQAPVEGAKWLHAAGGERVALKRENDTLRAELLLAQARLNAARIEIEQSLRLQDLVETAQRHRLAGRMISVFDIDIDPYRQRLLLDGGSVNGVRVGQPVIDAWGLVGQVVVVSPTSSTVLLLTDSEHAVPVRNLRTGQRAVAYGQGRDDRILVPNLPMNSDLEIDDVLVTSGLGGRFPSGFPVAVIRELGPDANGNFAQAWAQPFADLRRSSELLLLDELREPDAGAEGGESRAMDVEPEDGESTRDDVSEANDAAGQSP